VLLGLFYEPRADKPELAAVKRGYGVQLAPVRYCVVLYLALVHKVGLPRLREPVATLGRGPQPALHPKLPVQLCDPFFVPTVLPFEPPHQLGLGRVRAFCKKKARI